MRILVTAITLLLSVVIVGAIVTIAWLKQIAAHTPDTEALLNARGALPSVLLSADGTHLATYSKGIQQRVTLDQVSPHVVEALIATEDHRFRAHRGIDLRRTLSAAWHTLRGDAVDMGSLEQLSRIAIRADRRGGKVVAKNEHDIGPIGGVSRH